MEDITSEVRELFEDAFLKSLKNNDSSLKNISSSLFGKYMDRNASTYSCSSAFDIKENESFLSKDQFWPFYYDLKSYKQFSHLYSKKERSFARLIPKKISQLESPVRLIYLEDLLLKNVFSYGKIVTCKVEDHFKNTLYIQSLNEATTLKIVKKKSFKLYAQVTSKDGIIDSAHKNSFDAPLLHAFLCIPNRDSYDEHEKMVVDDPILAFN